MQSSVEELLTRLLRPTKVLIASDRIDEISQALSRYECYPVGYQPGANLSWFDLVLMDSRCANAKKLLHDATALGIPVAVVVDGEQAFTLLESDNFFIAVLPPVTKADIDRIFRVLRIKPRAKADAAYFASKQRSFDKLAEAV